MTFIPENYKPVLTVMETEAAIADTKRIFEKYLSAALNLRRISAPMFVRPESGLNDNLNGVERPVSFDIPSAGTTVEVVHSLAKWKRNALAKYGFAADSGLYCDMNALRRDEELDNLHSVYVDQWDWERVITAEERSREFLLDVVGKIVGAMCDTQAELKTIYPALPDGNTRSQSSRALSLSCRSAGRCRARASRTTDARRTTTIGASTAI